MYRDERIDRGRGLPTQRPISSFETRTPKNAMELHTRTQRWTCEVPATARVRNAPSRNFPPCSRVVCHFILRVRSTHCQFPLETRGTIIYLLLSKALNSFSNTVLNSFLSLEERGKLSGLHAPVNRPPVFCAQALPTTLSVATPEHPSITI